MRRKYKEIIIEIFYWIFIFFDDLLDYKILVFDNIEDLLADALIGVDVSNSATRTISWALDKLPNGFYKNYK